MKYEEIPQPSELDMDALRAAYAEGRLLEGQDFLDKLSLAQSVDQIFDLIEMSLYNSGSTPAARQEVLAETDPDKAEAMARAWTHGQFPQQEVLRKIYEVRYLARERKP